MSRSWRRGLPGQHIGRPKAFFGLNDRLAQDYKEVIAYQLYQCAHCHAEVETTLGMKPLFDHIATHLLAEYYPKVKVATHA